MLLPGIISFPTCIALILFTYRGFLLVDIFAKTLSLVILALVARAHETFLTAVSALLYFAGVIFQVPSAPVLYSAGLVVIGKYCTFAQRSAILL